MAEAPGGPWDHAFVQTPSGHKIHYVQAGPATGLPVVLVHGWPDLWFGWRHQIKALAPTYRVLALDLRGFGQSSSPAEQSAYGAKNVTSDFVALLDALEIEKAVFIGHDWGGAMVWRMALHHPERVIAVSGICVPYVPPSEVYVEMHDLVKVMPMFAYWNYLMDVETSAPCLDTSPRRLFNVFYRRSNERLPLPNPDALVNLFKGVKDSTDPIYTTPATLLKSDEIDYYVDQYTKASFRGGCYYYGARKIDYDDERGLSPVLRMPALFIYADKDPVFNLKMAEHMPLVIPNLQIKCVEDAGHFVLPEKPEEVNALLLEWLAQLVRAS